MAQVTPSISIRYTTYGAGFNAATYEPKTPSASKYEDVVIDCHNFRAAPVSRALADIWDKAIAHGQKTLGDMIMEKIDERKIKWRVVTGFQMIDVGARGDPGDEVVYVAVHRTETVEPCTEIKWLRSVLYPAVLEVLANAGATKVGVYLVFGSSGPCCLCR